MWKMSNPTLNTKLLEEKARWVWSETLKIHQRSPETRVASSLSPIELFVVLYYGGILKFDPKNPLWSGRDRCIISKGHGSLCMYPILADLGYFSSSELEKVCQSGSFLGGIPDPIIPGYETVNGSLGHGLGVSAGMALGLKSKGANEKVYVLTGDGELHEGANWEAIMFSAQQSLSNLTLIVDNNQICMLGQTDHVVSHLNLEDKFKAFGWSVFLIDDGHSVAAIQAAFERSERDQSGKPKVIIANTRKGNGVPGLEGADLSHVTAIKPELIEELLNGGVSNGN